MTTAKCGKCSHVFTVYVTVCGSAFPQCPHCGSHGPLEWNVPINPVAIAGGLIPAAQISLLKSVDEHNAQKRREREERERKAKLTGVACPKCGGELEWDFGLHATRAAARQCLFGIDAPMPARCGPCNLTVELER